MTFKLRPLDELRYKDEMCFYLWGDIDGCDVRLRLYRGDFADKYGLRDNISRAFRRNYVGESQAACAAASERYRGRIQAGMTIDVIPADYPERSRLEAR